MDADCLLIKCSILTVEACMSYFMYSVYEYAAEYLKTLKEAPHFELDSELQKSVEINDGVVKYAVISGKVKALTSPLKSQYVPYLQGVIREKITREHKIKWAPFFWRNTKQDHQHIIECKPFSLCSKSYGLFKKQIAIEVVEPLVGVGMSLPVVHNQFISDHTSIGDAVFGFFGGEQTIAVQEIEKMLCENETLTVVGKLVLENNKLKIKPPDDEDLKYIVTRLPFESMVSIWSTLTRVFKVTSIILGAITLGTFFYLSGREISKLKRILNNNQAKKRLEEQRKWKRMADRSRNDQNANIPKCAVCLEYPVEVLILECGHACLCYSCSEQVRAFCPVCRYPIRRIVRTFWS